MSSSFERLQQDAQQQVIEMLDDGCDSHEIIQYISECIDKLGYSFCTRDIISMAWYKEEMKLIDYLLWLYPRIFTSRSRNKPSSIHIPDNALLDYVDDSRMANIIVILQHPNIDLNDQNLIHEILSLYDTTSDDERRNCWISLLKPLLASKQKIDLHQRFHSFGVSYASNGEELISTYDALEFAKTFLEDEECCDIMEQYEDDPNKTRKALRMQIGYCKTQDSTMVYCLILCIKQDWLAIINIV